MFGSLVPVLWKLRLEVRKAYMDYAGKVRGGADGS